MLGWLVGAALAQEPGGEQCPAVGAILADAWASFDDAELAAASERLHAGRDALACQPDVVPTDALLEMFRLDGLVALSQADREDAVYATIRAVTIDPDSVPPETYGPELSELTATWKARLASRTAEVRATGVEQAWVDGRMLHAGDPYPVVPGEHLVQWRDPDGFHSAVVDVATAYTIEGTAPVVPEGPDGPDGPKPPGSSKGRVPVIVAGTALAAAGAGVVAWSSGREKDFLADPFDAEQYGECVEGDSCYGYAREEAIRASAAGIRAGYLAGYALVAVGVGGAGAGVFLLSGPAGLPSGLGVSVRW